MKSMRLTFILGLVSTCLSACGSHFSTNQQEIAADALTEGRNPDGRTYTSFSEPATVDNIKEHVSFTDENKKFASQIESITKSTEGENLKINMKWNALANPLIFSGKLISTKDGFSASLHDQTSQKPELQVDVLCETQTCDSLNAFLKEDSGNLIGFILRHGTRIITFEEASSQKDQIKLLPQEKQQVFAQFKSGMSVNLDSFEVYPGKSYYQISQGSNLLEGELLNIDEGAAPTKAQGLFANLGTIELIGNNEGNSETGGELQFKITNSVQQKQIVSYLTMETSMPLLTSRKSLETALGTDSLVQQILNDESNEVVQAYISKNLLRSTTPTKNSSQPPGVSNLLKYLGCEEGDKKACGNDRQGRDKTAVVKNINTALRQNGLPAAWGLIAFMESQFEANAYNKSSGASGYWQFIPSTARIPEFGLIRNGKDLRSDLQASTRAASLYFKELLREWNGDVKMSIISYTMGEYAVKTACMKSSADKTNCDIQKNLKYNEQKQVQDLYDLNRRDFWTLYKLHTFGAMKNGVGAQDYTIKFLSENLVSFHPQHYGYTNRAVDLN